MTTKDLRSTDPLDVEERGSFTYVYDLTKDDGTAVAAGDLSVLRATLYDVVTFTAAGGTGGIINSRDDLTILNANGGTFAAGHGELTLGPDDHPIVALVPATAIGALQIHRLLIEAVWADGAKRWEHAVRVRNLGHVP